MEAGGGEKSMERGWEEAAARLAGKAVTCKSCAVQQLLTELHHFLLKSISLLLMHSKREETSSVPWNALFWGAPALSLRHEQFGG